MSSSALTDADRQLAALGHPAIADPAFVGAIVAMSSERVIGLDGDMPWHYSADLKRFKRVTMGGSVVMGRKTWDAVGRRALPGRTNVVLSRGKVPDVSSFTSLEAAMANSPGPVWIIGGAQVYQLAMPLCHMLDITWVPDRIDAIAAVRFPDINPREWIAGPREALVDDPRLVNQRFYRAA